MTDDITRVLRCYVASPFGFTEAGRDYYRRVVLPTLGSVAELIDPWAIENTDRLADRAGSGTERERWLDVGRRNQVAIAGADLLVAFLDGQELDSGTASEIGYAAGLEKPCFGVRTDLRQSGEVGMRVNLQVESLILTSGGRLVNSLDELTGALTGSVFSRLRD